MQWKTRQIKWAVVFLAALLTVLLIVAILPKKTEEPIQTTVPTTTAEPTLPPPEENPYGPLDFQYQGKYLTCLTGRSVLGIDVSAHQQQIDWQAVADAGVEFVMIRAGYRGYETGQLQEDVCAQRNYAGARQAGLLVGAYFFSQAVSPAEAREEAIFFLQIIRDWQLDMPAVYDWEHMGEDSRGARADARTVTECTRTFCQTVEAAGYVPMVYFNRHHAMDYLYLEELTEYPFWLALYSDRMTYPYRVEMWQYTEEGKVPGIEGFVDINLWLPE